MISTLLIDRETHCITTLADLLNTYCPWVEVCGLAYTREEACRLLQGSSSELVFLGMNMVSGNGGSIFEQASCEFETIIIYPGKKPGAKPAHIDACAHLFKPVGTAELIEAVDRIRQRIHWKKMQREIRKLLSRLANQSPPNNLIGIPAMEGMEFLKVGEISRCEGLQRFTRVVTTEGNNIISSYNIGEFCKLLRPYGFFSPHKSHLINLQHIRRYSQEGTIIMQEGSAVPVSRRRKALFLKEVGHL